jgi:thiamine transporter ThiT
VKTYHVTPKLAGFNPKRSLLRMLVAGALFAALQMLLSILWPSSTMPAHRLEDSIRAVIGGVIFGPLFILLMRRMFTYEVVVSADCITLHGFGFRRSVRREEAKTIIESSGSAFVAPALRISKHGRLGTWFWGCIWVPKAVPEYEYIRDLALGWKAGLQA